MLGISTQSSGIGNGFRKGGKNGMGTSPVDRLLANKQSLSGLVKHGGGNISSLFKRKKDKVNLAVPRRKPTAVLSIPHTPIHHLPATASNASEEDVQLPIAVHHFRAEPPL